MKSEEKMQGGLKPEIEEYLAEHSIEASMVERIKSAATKENEAGPNSFNISIASLKKQAAAYNWSDEQIKAYLSCLVEVPTQIIGSASENNSNISDKPKSTRTDSKGIGYEAKSTYKFYMASAYGQIPSFSNAKDNFDNINGYMFFSLEAGSGTMDIGIYYANGATSGLGWRGFYLYGVPEGEPEKALMNINFCPIKELSAGSKFYMSVEYVYSTDDYVRIRVYDSNFTSVYIDSSVYAKGYLFGYDKTSFNRQITLTDGTKTFKDTVKMSNASFSDGRVYDLSSTEGMLMTKNNCIENNCGAFKTDGGDGVITIYEADTEKWYKEKVTLSFV